MQVRSPVLYAWEGLSRENADLKAGVYTVQQNNYYVLSG